MKIIYIHQYFVTNEGSLGTRSYDVSKYAVAGGHSVTVICGRHEQSGLPELPWWKPFAVYMLDGIKVVVCNVYYSNKMKVPGRLWSFFGFALLATCAALAERSADIVFGTSTPLTVGIPTRISALVKGIPYVFEVRDLWPEDLLAAGRLQPGLQYRVWQWLESFSYARARKILLVSKGFHDRLLERGFDPEMLATIELGADGGLFKGAAPDSAYMERNGLVGKTVAVYAGAHGDANGLMQLVDVAERLAHRHDIVIALIGDGKMRTPLMAEAERRGLANIRFLPPVPKHELPRILCACHIGLMILKQITRPRWVTPNKIFDYMFAGLPTIVNFSGTTAEMVEREAIGVASVPGSPDDLAKRIMHWADNSGARARAGARALTVAREKYDRSIITARLLTVFEEVVSGKR